MCDLRMLPKHFCISILLQFVHIKFCSTGVVDQTVPDNSTIATALIIGVVCGVIVITVVVAVAVVLAFWCVIHQNVDGKLFRYTLLENFVNCVHAVVCSLT